MDQHFRAALGRLDMKACDCVGGAATFGVAALGLQARAMTCLIDTLELDAAGKGQRDRPEPNRDLALVILRIDNFSELGAGHTGHDAGNIL